MRSADCMTNTADGRGSFIQSGKRQNLVEDIFLRSSSLLTFSTSILASASLTCAVVPDRSPRRSRSLIALTAPN